MTDTRPHIRSAGTGPNVLCLHSSASSSKQWQSLMDELSPEFQVSAVDLYGYGKSPEWRGELPVSLSDEVALVKTALDELDGPVHLVGHSYGGAVAMELARTHPDRIESLSVYEPVMFSHLFEDDPGQEAAREIHFVEQQVRQLVKAGKKEAAARMFIAYWTDDKAWDGFDDRQRQAIIEKMTKVTFDFAAVFSNPTALAEYESIDIPMLLLYGTESPWSTRRIVELLRETIPHVEMHPLSGLGHMGPVTHPTRVNPVISRFVRKHTASRVDRLIATEVGRHSGANRATTAPAGSSNTQ
jgi:pimeloyl-ACP methyl ester carboxylesterase